jgi:hypothetical protein
MKIQSRQIEKSGQEICKNPLTSRSRSRRTVKKWQNFQVLTNFSISIETFGSRHWCQDKLLENVKIFSIVKTNCLTMLRLRDMIETPRLMYLTIQICLESHLSNEMKLFCNVAYFGLAFHKILIYSRHKVEYSLNCFIKTFWLLYSLFPGLRLINFHLLNFLLLNSHPNTHPLLNTLGQCFPKSGPPEWPVWSKRKKNPLNSAF